MIHCPVCSKEYIKNKVNFCTNCGWDLTTLEEFSEFYQQKEAQKLTWAKGMWQKCQFQQEKYHQLQSQLSQCQESLKQSEEKNTQFKLELQQLNKDKNIDNASLNQLQLQIDQMHWYQHVYSSTFAL